MTVTDVNAPVSRSDTVHGRLRRATVDEHHRLDRGLAYVLSDRLSPERYANLLAALLGFYGPLEDCLARWAAGPQPLGLPLIRRSGLLQRDLRALGRDPGLSPMCAEMPALTTTGHAVGAVYVVEGACLGGQVIARTVVRRHGIGPETGAAFFTGDGARTAARWTHVLAWLDERGRDPVACDDMMAGACRTFTALRQWLAIREVLDA